MRLFGLKLNSLLVIAVAALLAMGAISAFADSGPPDPPGDGVTVDDGDTDGEGEGHAFGRGHGQGKPDGVPPDDGETDGDVGVLSNGDGPNPDRGCANGSLEHAREVLEALLEREHPGENEGIRNALEKMCHGTFASNGAGPGVSGGGDGDESGDHPGNGNAFGRGHGQGKPEGVPTNGGDGE
ncbi:MAG: hypothetical protein IIA23_06375 [Chloroflexi bacterium]|nr:hypothetical protein [Chloroflexota bacterium]